MTETLHLTADRAGIRLDRYISQEYPGLSRSYVQRLINQGFIVLNQRVAKPSLKLNIGDKVDLTLPPPTALAPEDIPLRIVYEDSDLLVIDKPPGLTVHPAPGHPDHTLVNAILAHCPHLPGVDSLFTHRNRTFQPEPSLRPGIVHRLDKDTSGLMMVAKTTSAQLSLSHQFKSRKVAKGYLVLVHGQPILKQDLIEAPIGRHPLKRKRMAIVVGGKEARTLYRVLEQIGEFTLLEVTTETGRTHQIRVHLSAIGHPVVGDAIYGMTSPHLQRQFVHAHRLGFTLPASGEYVEFKSELPADLAGALSYFRSFEALEGAGAKSPKA